jgi:hypothetical protein
VLAYIVYFSTRVAYHELLLNLAESVQTSLELNVVVGRGLSNGRDDGDPVALGADVVSGRNAGDVDIYDC